MSVNRFQPHALVLPEDDANRQLANGFLRELDQSALKRIQVLPAVGGWMEVLSLFESDHVADMHRCANRSMVLLIDFDDDAGRLKNAKDRVPPDLVDRVFVLGVFSEPEKLRSAGLGSYEAIGSELARDCRSDSYAAWSHELLRHNIGELSRLRERVRPILFA